MSIEERVSLDRAFSCRQADTGAGTFLGPAALEGMVVARSSTRSHPEGAQRSRDLGSELPNPA
jgi:hypothetical protein